METWARKGVIDTCHFSMPLGLQDQHHGYESVTITECFNTLLQNRETWRKILKGEFGEGNTWSNWSMEEGERENIQKEKVRWEN